MDKRIRELVDFTRGKFGLDHYLLHSAKLYRKINLFNETVYTLGMEWFPKRVTEQVDDGFNPEGTAVIDIDVNSRKFESVIFVGGKSYTNGISFSGFDTKDIIQWIEQETGLLHGSQFQLEREGKGELFFKECMNGTAVSPAGCIEIKCDSEGRLTFFSVHGEFPAGEIVKEEAYSLSIDMIEELAKEQLTLIEFPSYGQKRLVPVYAVEEIYISNDQAVTFPFSFIVDVRSYLKIDKPICWDTPIDKEFERKEFHIIEDVTVQQAFSAEPHPDSFPITQLERDECVIAVRTFLRQEYPHEPGRWILNTLHRDKGYIHATLRVTKQDKLVIGRKLVLMIDSKSLQVQNYIDNKPMLEIFDRLQAPGKVTITKEEAYGTIKELFELKPYYVYDFEQRQYILCGKLDCRYGVNATNGKVILLDEL